MLKPVVLTSTHTCSPQLPAAFETLMLSGALETGAPVFPPSVVQVIATDPSCNAGISAVLVLLITSTEIGVLENWIGKVPLAVGDASKQTWYSTRPSSTLMPCKLLSSHATPNCPAVVVLKLGIPKSGKFTWLIVAAPNCVPSQFNECWKATKLLKPVVLTSTHTCSPQLPVAFETLILNGVVLVEGVGGSSVSVASSITPQVMVAVPFCNVGIIGFPAKSIISMGTGELENWIGRVPLVVVDTSKQTWYKTWSASSVTPCKEVSSQPTLNTPDVVALKLAVFKSGKPNWVIWAVPKSIASQIKECWKAKTFVNPEVLTSTHICSPQLPATSEILSVKSVLELVGVVSISSHITATLPSVKAGFNGIPSLSIISIGVGLPEKEMGEVRVAPEEAVKHNWNNTSPSGTVIPAKEGSSQPTRAWPAKSVLKLLAVSPSKLKFCTVAVPNKMASQSIEYWNDNTSVKSVAVISTQVCSPQLTVVEDALMVTMLTGISVFVVSIFSSVLISQAILTDPFCKLGVKELPSKSATSILKGTSLIATELTPLALAGTLKHTSYSTKSSCRLSPIKEESS